MAKNNKVIQDPPVKKQDPNKKPLLDEKPIEAPAENWIDDLYNNKSNYQNKLTTGIAGSAQISAAAPDMAEKLGNRFQLNRGESALINEYNQIIQQEAYDTAKRDAEEQGFWGELYGFTAQALVGEVVLGTIGGVGYLLDFENWTKLISGDNADWGNWLSDSMDNAKDFVRDAAPIHMDPDAEGKFAPWADGWWAKNGVSMASAASLLIPVAGWARGVGMVGKGIGTLGKLAQVGKFGNVARRGTNIVQKMMGAFPQMSKTQSWMANGIHQAVVSRQIEGLMEANGVFKEKYAEYINRGMSEEDANAAAGSAAAFTYKADWAMLASDIPQYLLLGRAMGMSKAVDSVKLAKAAGINPNIARMNIGKTYMTQFMSEGFEEGYQYMAAEEGKQYGDGVAGIAKNVPAFNERVKEYLKSGELWTSAFFGGLGGVAFQFAGPKIQSIIQKKLLAKGETWLSQEDMRVKEIEERYSTLSADLAAYREALDFGDERVFEQAKSRIGFNLGVNAARVGNFDILMDGLDQLQKSPDDFKEEYGLDESFFINIEDHKANIRLGAELFDHNSKKYTASTVYPITYREFMIETSRKRLGEVQNEAELLKQKIPKINSLDVNAKSAFEAKLQIKSSERYIAGAEYAMDKMEISDANKATLKQNIVDAKSFLKEHKAALNSLIAVDPNLSKNSVLNSLDSVYTEELSKATAEAQWLETLMDNYVQEIHDLASPAGQNAATKREEAAVATAAATQSQTTAVADQNLEENEMVGEEQVTEMNWAEVEADIKRGKIKEDQLPPEVKAALDDYRKSKGTLNEAASSDIANSDPDGFNEEGATDFSSLFAPVRDPKKDLTAEREVVKTDHETPVNDEDEDSIRRGDDTADRVYLSTAEALAWKSSNNTFGPAKEPSVKDKALTSFLEGPYDVTGLEIVFVVDEDFLNAKENAADKEYKKVKTSLSAGNIPDNVGYVPVKGILHKNGKPVIHKGESLEMYLHEEDFKYRDDIREAAIVRLKEHKRLVVEAYLEGKSVQTSVISKSNGHINITETDGGVFATNNLRETIGDPKDIEFLYGANSTKDVQNGAYVDSNGNPDFDIAQTAKNGAIYAKIKTANGTPFPLRMHVSHLSRNESYTVYRLIVDLLEDPEKFSAAVNPEIIEGIRNSSDPLLSGLQGFLALDSISYKDLLDNLVYNGQKKTGHAGDSRLFIAKATDKVAAKVVFGSHDADLEGMKTSDGTALFIEHMQKHRRRQVDAKLLENETYKAYIVDNNIVTTNAEKTPEGNLFIQPTVTYGSEMSSFEGVVESPVLEEDVIATDTWNAFVNDGIIDPKTLEVIANKLMSGIPLSAKENAIHSDKASEVEVNIKEISEKDFPKKATQVKTSNSTTIANIEKRREEELYGELSKEQLKAKLWWDRRNDGDQRSPTYFLSTTLDVLNDIMYLNSNRPDVKKRGEIKPKFEFRTIAPNKKQTYIANINEDRINIKYDTELKNLTTKTNTKDTTITEINARRNFSLIKPDDLSDVAYESLEKESGIIGTPLTAGSAEESYQASYTVGGTKNNPQGIEETFTSDSWGKVENWINTKYDSEIADLQIPEFNPTKVDAALAHKIQDRLTALYPEIKIQYTNEPITDKPGEQVFNQQSQIKDAINYRLKVVDSLLSMTVPKETKGTRKYGIKGEAERVTVRLSKEANLRKTLARKGVPADQIDFVFDYMKSNNIQEITTEELALDIAAGYGYTVEVKVTIDDNVDFDPNIGFRYIEHPETIFNPKTLENEVTGKWLVVDRGPVGDSNIVLSTQGTLTEAKRFINNLLPKQPSQYYTQLRTPGGTNYRENEILTPEITPNITGHAEFSTTKGIGWFRSDDQEIGGVKEGIDKSKIRSERVEELMVQDKSEEEIGTILEKEFPNITGASITKTRRILEVQSDLFQKSRGSKDLITNTATNYGNIVVEKVMDHSIGKEVWAHVDEETDTPLRTFSSKESAEKALTIKSETASNQFLQLLNKKGNWINFFVQSIVQDSAAKGYDKVLFPKGETAAKIEGHETLANELIDINQKIKKLEERGMNSPLAQDIASLRKELDIIAETKPFNEEAYDYTANELFRLESQLEDSGDLEALVARKKELKTQGIEKLNPIESFYEIRMGNVLNKLFGSNAIKTITDEHGNEWRELTINPIRDLSPIMLQKDKDKIIGQANIKAMTVLIDAAAQKQDTLPHEYAHHYVAWFRNTPIVQEAIKKWGSEEALVQAIGEQVVAQRGEANSFWKKFVNWIFKQFENLTKLEKEQLRDILTDTFLEGISLTTQKPITSEESIALAGEAVTFYNTPAEAEEQFHSATDMSALFAAADAATETVVEEDNALEDMMRQAAENNENNNEGSAFKKLEPDTIESTNYKVINNEAAHIRTLLPHEIAITLQDDYLRVMEGGMLVQGLFQNGGIALSRKAEVGTGYHEAFHAVFRTMLTPLQLTTILHEEAPDMFTNPTEAELNEIVKIHMVGPHAAKMIWYEEQLADEFGVYMTNPKKYNGQYPSTISGFFSRLLKWIQNVFSNRKTTDKLFNDIAKGKYRTKVPVITRRDVAFSRRHPVFTPTEVNDITKALAFSALRDVKDLKDVGQTNFKYLEAEILAAFKKADDSGDKNLKKRAMNVYKEKEYFKTQVKQYLREVLDIETIEEPVEDSDGNVVPRSSFMFSSKDNATATVKFLVSRIPEIAKYEDGKAIYANTSYLGTPTFEDFSVTWNTLLKNLSGVVPMKIDGVYKDGFGLMIDKLDSIIKYYPSLRFLKERLLESPEHIQTQFYYVFSNNQGKYLDHLISGPAGYVTSKIANSDAFSKDKAIREIWGETFAKKVGSSATQSNNAVYDTTKLAKIRELYSEYKTALGVDKAGKQLSPQTYSLFIRTLDALGVNMDGRAFRKLIDSQDVSLDLPQNQRDIRALELITFKMDQAVGGTKTRLSLWDTTGQLIDNTNFLLHESFFLELAAFESEFRKVQGESMFIGPEGNSIYSYQDNNLVTKSISKMKGGDIALLEEILDTPYGRNSIWANWLTDTKKGSENREALIMTHYGNYKREGANDGGDKASNLKDPDKFNDVVNKYLKGYYVGLAEADKSQQNYLSGPPMQRAFIQVQPDGKLGFSTPKPPAVTVLRNYFSDELGRMRAAWEALHGENPMPLDQQIQYYHYGETPGDGKGNAFNSYMFPELTATKDGIEHLGLKKLGLMDKETGEILLLHPTRIENNQALNSYIGASFLEMVQKDLDTAEHYGVIRSENKGYKNNTIDYTVSKRYGNIAEAIGDYTINSIVANVEFTKLFTGDPALYKYKGDGFVDFRKRIPAIFASGRDFRSYSDAKGVVVVKETYSSATISNIERIPSNYFADKDNLAIISKNTGITQGALKELFAPYLEVNQTDAQAWITLDTYRERLLGLGKWTPAHQDAYEVAKAGKKMPVHKIVLLAQPLKTTHAELMLHNGVHTMQYNKQSEAVLLPGLIKGTDLAELNDAMIAQGTEHVIVNDGKKSGAIGITNIVEEGTNKILPAKDIELYPTYLKYSNLFLQQDLPSKGIKDTAVGTQAVKNVLSVVNLEGLYFKDDVTGRELIDEYHNVISKLSGIGLEEFHKSIGYNMDNNTLDLNKFYKTVAKEFEGEVSDNIMEAIEGKMPLDAIPQYRLKIQNRLNAIITKKAVKLKQLGGAFVQLSNFGMLGMKVDLNKRVMNDIIWFKNPKDELKPMEAVEGGTSKAAQVLIPHSKLMQLLEKQGINYKGYTHNQIKASISKEVLQGFSYRIPNQGAASNDAFEIVGVLPPEVGDTMIAFKEITTKTGSDFDIDKAYVILPDFKYNKDTKKIEKIQYTEDVTSLDYKAGLQNRRLDMMRAMLLHPEAFASVMAPLDDPWLSTLAKKHFPESSTAQDLNFWTGTSQLNTKSTFDNAKSLVGAIANFMTFYSLTKSEGLYFTDYYMGKGQKHGEVGGLKRVSKAIPFNYGNNKELILSGKKTITSRNFKYIPNLEKGESGIQYIDNTPFKITYYGELNHNEVLNQTKIDYSEGEAFKFTTKGAPVEQATKDFIAGKGTKHIYKLEKVYEETTKTSLSNNLDEAGNSVENTLGALMNAIVDAAKDPYISRMNINQVTAGTAFTMALAGIDREWIIAFMGQPILKDLVSEMGVTEGRVSEIIGTSNEKALDKVIKKYGFNGDMNVFKKSIDPLNLFGEITLTSKTLFSNLKQDINTMEFKDTQDQLAILAQFLEWQDKAKEVNEVIKVAKSDVNGATKNLTSAAMQENLLQKIVEEGNVGNLPNLLGYKLDEEFDVIFDNTRMTGTYHENAVRTALKIYGPMFLTGSSAYLNALKNIAKDSGRIHLTPTKKNELLADMINNELYAATVASSELGYNGDKSKLTDLLFGTKEKESISNRVAKAKSFGELKDNALLQALDIKPSYYKDIPANIYLAPKALDKEAKQDLYLAWEELLLIDKELGEDLIKYAYYASGFKIGFGVFFEHIPTSWLQNNGFSEFIKEKRDLYHNSPQELAEQEDAVFKHKYMDNYLVPSMNKALILPLAKQTVFKTSDMFKIDPSKGGNYIIGKDENGFPKFKKYVKTVLPVFDQSGELVATNVSLFRLLGYVGINGAPLYGRTNKLGLSDKGLNVREYGGDNNVSIFPKNNVSLPWEGTSSDVALNEAFDNLVIDAPIEALNEYDESLNNNPDVPEDGREDRLNNCFNQS